VIWATVMADGLLAAVDGATAATVAAAGCGALARRLHLRAAEMQASCKRAARSWRSPTSALPPPHRSTAMTRRIIRTATTAIAIVALAAPTALARPADMPPSAAAAAAAAIREQDMRSPDAIDAATPHKQARLPSEASQYPTRPAQGEQANPRPETPPQAPADPSVASKMIGLGIAGLLAAAAIAVLVSRTRRSARARIAA
jgi:hypothetical protein